MALTLGRKKGETIVIRPDDESQNEIRFSISDVIGNCIRITIDAPKSAVIYREELLIE